MGRRGKCMYFCAVSAYDFKKRYLIFLPPPSCFLWIRFSSQSMFSVSTVTDAVQLRLVIINNILVFKRKNKYIPFRNNNIKNGIPLSQIDNDFRSKSGGKIYIYCSASRSTIEMEVSCIFFLCA